MVARSCLGVQLIRRRFSSNPFYHSTISSPNLGDEDEGVPTSGISRPLSHILKDLNRKVPDSSSGSATNHLEPNTSLEWSGEVRSITYSADGRSVTVVYRVTLYGTDAEIFRESTGTAPVDHSSSGNPVHKAEAMAFRGACARFGLGLHLYHEDLE